MGLFSRQTLIFLLHPNSKCVDQHVYLRILFSVFDSGSLPWCVVFNLVLILLLLLSVLSSLAIVSLREGEMVASLPLSLCCRAGVFVLSLFLAVPWVGL